MNSTGLSSQRASSLSNREEQNEKWKRNYMEMLLNPFSTTLDTPKILDSEVPRSAAIKLRSTGEIVCSATGVTNIFLFPGLTNVICWCVEPDDSDVVVDDGSGGLTTPSEDRILLEGSTFSQHMSTATDRSKVRMARLTGAGMRLLLTNNENQNEGYWEAKRVNTKALDDLVMKTNIAGTLTGLGVLKSLATDIGVVNSNSYQFGYLKDIHQHIFKLNSIDNDHKFKMLTPLSTGSKVKEGIADIGSWDMVVVKVTGSKNVNNPTVIRFDAVSNQEIVYDEGSQLARMMTDSASIPDNHDFLEYSRLKLPSFKAS